MQQRSPEWHDSYEHLDLDQSQRFMHQRMEVGMLQLAVDAGNNPGDWLWSISLAVPNKEGFFDRVPLMSGTSANMHSVHHDCYHAALGWVAHLWELMKCQM